jgi:hypothetical protein
MKETETMDNEMMVPHPCFIGSVWVTDEFPEPMVRAPVLGTIKQCESVEGGWRGLMDVAAPSWFTAMEFRNGTICGA